MNRFTFGALAGVLALSTFETPKASAQPQVPVGPSRPIFSPYLNLLGGYGNPALNYFGIVQPQMQMQQQLTQLQLGMGTTGGQHADPSSLLPSTSSVPVFDNTFGYFNRMSAAPNMAPTGTQGRSLPATFGRPGSPIGATGGTGAGAYGGAAGFQRGATPGSGLQPSFAAPRVTPATNTPKQPTP